jgi:hypothetical protein
MEPDIKALLKKLFIPVASEATATRRPMLPEVTYDPLSRPYFGRSAGEAQDEYGYVSPAREQMQELLARNATELFPSRTDVPSEFYTTGLLPVRGKDQELDERQNRLYQAQQVMNALERQRQQRARASSPAVPFDFYSKIKTTKD